MTSSPTTVLPDARARLTDHEQMLDAQNGCVPCKLCGGNAIITDAGTGAGYYIRCRNSVSFRDYNGCLLDERRLSGWAYNVMDWWNRLHATPPAPDAAVPAGEVLPQHIGRVHLGERRSDGERLCSHGHSIVAGQALYWPERIGEYPDDVDPFCLEHAIEQAVDDNGWCEKCTAIEFAAAPKSASDTGAGLREALLVFASCARELDAANTPDDEWAKFRLLASDYRRAYRFYVARFGEPPFPEDAHAALATDATDADDREELYRLISAWRQSLANPKSWMDRLRSLFVTGGPDLLEQAAKTERSLSWVIAEAKRTLRLVQGCMECNANDERRWSETIEWLERLA